MKKLKGLDGKLDDAWSLLVKLEAGMRCEYCGTDKNLNSHHIYSRSNRSVRWDESNGVSLCVAHHTFSSGFSAHKTPLEFVYWLEEEYGKVYMDELRLKANSTKKWMKFEKEELLKELNDKIETYKQKIKEL
jgi:hypothetical protein